MHRLSQLNLALSEQHNCYDYLIIGTGISGLQAAEILTSHGKKILMLEAQSQIGGRIKSTSVGDLSESRQAEWIMKDLARYKGVSIEKGATWIEQRHRMLLKICRMYNITLIEQYSKGSGTYLAQDKPYSRKDLMESPLYGPTISRVLKLLDDIAEQYDREVLANMNNPSNRGRTLLKMYQSVTIDEFLRLEIPESHAAVRQLFDNFFEHTECLACSENSMHEALTKHARSNDVGILKQFLGVYNEHEPSYVLDGGTSVLIQKFQAGIERNIKASINSLVKFRHQVLTIDNRQPNFVIVVSEDLLAQKIVRYRARKVICAVPLAVSKQIQFTNISPAKKLIIDSQTRTNCAKSIIIVRKPFWRAEANGDGLFSSDHLVNMCHDISPEDESCGIMVFFHSGKKLDAWTSLFTQGTEEDELQLKKKYLIDLMCKMFRVPADQQTVYFDQCVYYESSYRTDQFIRSGFQSNTRAGTFGAVLKMGDSLQSFYRDENGVIFIGSEYSLRFASYIEGAIRVAREKVYGLLQKPDPLKLTLEEENDI